MKQVDIMEVICSSIENKIFEEWKHDGFIGGWNSESINFKVDGLDYVLTLKEREQQCQ